MQVYKFNQNLASRMLSELQKNDLLLTVTGENSLRIKGKATESQLKVIRLFKAQIINRLSPKCSKCDLEMALIENGKTWFCSMGCESRKADQSKTA